MKYKYELKANGVKRYETSRRGKPRYVVKPTSKHTLSLKKLQKEHAFTGLWIDVNEQHEEISKD